MTPQAVPKLLKFKFNEKSLKQKYKGHIQKQSSKPKLMSKKK